MAFTDDELADLNSQRLARLATVDLDEQPDVVPVGFEYDGTLLRHWRNGPDPHAQVPRRRGGRTKVAFVINDLASVDPWAPRYLKVDGTAELVERHGQFGNLHDIRITPTTSWSFNLDGQGFSHDRPVVVHRTNHPAPTDSED
jgi:pyridoxamine 5'-phosphate oxidase family protein